jgi:hypothetical protein
MGKRHIGRYDVNSLGGFPGFKMTMICATFHSAGKYPLSKTALNNWVRYFIPMIGSIDRLCGLVVRVLGYRSGGPGSIPGTNRKKKKI